MDRNNLAAVMSFMKKMLPSRMGQSDSQQSHSTGSDTTLGLTHLRKLFVEFRQPTAKVTQKDQEDKLYNMLPLFCKVFENAPSSDMTEKWGDILQFCSHVSKLMVTEIRRRASNQSTEAASRAIVELLEAESGVDNGNGWLLLGSINLLSLGGQALIDCMTAASLPSTLVKCLYLFFDLPPVEDGKICAPGCQFSPNERRVLLQKVFVQVLVRLCNYVSPAEELARKDDLSLLFSAITSWCVPHNVPWRQSAGEVLVTLSRHGLTPSVVKYIHDKGCVRRCVENMQRAQDLSPLEMVEMFVTVFCFLKDSSEVSQTLLDDFKSCQGYTFLADFLIRLEQDEKEESVQALRNLVLLVGSLTTSGFTELRPTTTNSDSLFHIPGFVVPQPMGKGVSVRNTQAFQVFQTVFIKAETSHLCGTVLDVLSSIYHQDTANYFILESQNTLSQFAEKIFLKPVDIQNKFFELLEFVVFNLNYVPCKELISLSILIKTQHSLSNSILCMKTLLKILRYHSVYRDVFREVGILEVMVTCLHRYAAHLKELHTPSQSEEKVTLSQEQQELGHLVMEALSVLLTGNSSNAGVFHQCGGARCAHNMVPYPECRQQALNIVQQLVLSPGGDDDMGTLLGLMPTANVTDLELKTHILKSLLNVLRESHRTRTVFRKVGGFVYVMSVLVSMEGSLEDPPKPPWNTVTRREVLMMLHTVFSTLTVAMRYEPANARFFATEVRYDSLTEAVRLLGCFSGTVDIPAAQEPYTTDPYSDLHDTYAELFSHAKEDRLKCSLPTTLSSACTMLRFLYDMSLDAFDRPSHLRSDSPCLRKHTSMIEDSCGTGDRASGSRPKRCSTGSMGLSLNGQPDPVVVHAGAVLSMFHLLPAIEHQSAKMALELQLFMAYMLKSLLRPERNQQILCDSGLPHELLTHASAALTDETHPLHSPLQHMFERLASQSLTPRDLRDFLRLGSPLSCRSVEEEYQDQSSLPWHDPDIVSRSVTMEEKQATMDTERKLQSAGGPVPLTRVKCLVSMTTPRDARMHGASVTPAFVEFDMAAEGFACLYLPSIAPQGPPTPSVVGGVVGTSEPPVIGGIGTGERVFPPQSGLTLSSWFCVDKFSSAGNDGHPVRLLTIVRNIHGREENLICLSVFLTSRDRALIVTTQESYMPVSGNGCEFEQDPALSDNTVRFWCPELTQEGQWHHLMLIFHRASIMKNSNVSLFVDGDHIDTQKLHYISPNLGGGGYASPAALTSVFAYIGSPPQLRRQSRLSWRQGPLYLLEDIVSSSVVSAIYHLGPTYVGSLQAPLSEENELSGPFIAEEKVMLAVHAHAMCQLTVAKVRKVYNRVDAKSIAKQLAMSAHENATPIRILHNAAGHLAGPARSLGAVLMGYLGVRTFCPKPVARMLENVGGTSCLLGLIAMATDVEGLYAAVKALVCVVRSNPASKWDMDRIRGYQLLAMLYKKKTSLLNSHILHLTFSLVGSLDSGRESAVIPNKVAFEDLLCDLEVWHKAPSDLQRSLYEHFYELLTDSSENKLNCELMRDMGLVMKLLNILRDVQLTVSTTHTIASVICELLTGAPDPHGLLRLGHFLVSTLPPVTFAERSLDLQKEAATEHNSSENITSSTDFRQFSLQHSISGDSTSGTRLHNVQVRNILLEVVLKLVLPPGSQSINQMMCEEIQRVLGFDCLLLFLQGHLHPTTVQLALQVLVVMLRNPENARRFREGTHRGGWLADTENVLKNQMAVMLGFNVGAGAKESTHEVNMEVCCIPGFQVLQWLLPRHTHIPAVFFLLMKLLLGQHGREMPNDVQLSLDSVWTVIFGVPASKPVVVLAREQVDLCPDAAMVILAMIRSMLNQLPSDDCIGGSSAAGSKVPNSVVEGEEDRPMTLIQFLMYLYHNVADFRTLCMSGEFITALVATLFPYPVPDYSSDVTTPNEEFKPFPDSEPIVMVKSQEKDMFTHLTQHPAKRFIIDFLRTLVIDSFSQQTTKLGAVLDVMLEAAPDHASRAQQREFQTTMLSVLMEHLLAADVLLGEQAALPMASTNTYATMAHSVFYFASRVVDKLWHGVYTRDSKEVFDFISKLISQSKRKSSGLSLDSIYKCLNRTILFQLSRPVDTVSGQTAILDALHTLTNNRNLVFGTSNYDQEFLACLCFCLLHLTDDPNMGVNSLNERQPRTTTWHIESGTVDLSLVGENGGPEARTTHIISSGALERVLPPEPMSSVLREGLHIVAQAAHRVWDELYICKKPALEEIFKTQLNNITSNTKTINTPELNTVRPMIQETASKMWVAYAESERKSSYLQTEKLQNQIQSKLQRMGSGVLRLASRKTKRELPIKASPVSNVHMSDFMMWSASHVDLVKEVVSFQYDQFMQSQKHMERYMLEEWQQVEKELLRERSLWGPVAGSRLQKWMLDMTEGPGRMRKKMTKNEMFYIHYPYRPDLEDNPLRYKVAISFDSREYYENFRPQGILCHEALPIQRTSDADLLNSDADQSPTSPEDIMNMRKLLPRSSSSKSGGDDEEGEESSALDSAMQGCEPGVEEGGDSTRDGPGDSQQEEPVPSSGRSDNQTIMRFLGDKEKISHMFRCARIQGLDTAEGLLLFGREHFYIIDGFTLLRTKEIKDIDSLPYEIHDPIIPKSSMGSAGPTKRMFSKFAFDDIREVHKRRYLLQPIAIEVFSGDGRNHLLAFPRKIRNKVFQKFLSVATAITDNAQTSVSGQRQNAKVESGGGIISSLIGEKSVTQRWERGEINNFQYLMHLNTLAGRSYNDLMQYPVFPWIIADYDSPELDFSQPSTFRDLSRPMGAQTPDRLKQFDKRYNEWDDPQGETPPYHYGTHYSSAMIVASYLVRMEPFTQHFLKLQGGHFDLADRMFHSVRENWLSASKHNMADVKELIPEFFYLPDFLLNTNNFDLGCKQNGVQLDDVILPPWAKGDAREFIRIHRQALESDFVSAHLHEWIDLIFGFKQRGPAAIDAHNVFHHLFYEGNVDIYSIQDPLKKNATIGFINNFGQIPKQLFKKPHPPKRLSARLLETLPMCASTGIAADLRLFFHHVDNLKPSMQPIKELKTAVGQIIHTDRYVLAVEQNKVLIPTNYSRYLAWGFADLSLRVGPYESEKAISVSELLDNGVIMCASCPSDKIFVTGGTSCVVRVWEYSGKDKKVSLKQPLYGHTEPVTCLTTSPAYNVIVSGSRDRTCIVWDMSRLIYVHQLRGHVAPVAAVCVNELTGDIATCAGTYLHLWNINGEAIASINTATGRNQQILCVAMSQFMEWDAQNVILTGSSDGVVRMWSVEYVQVPEEKEPAPAPSKSTEDKETSESSKTTPTPSSSATSQPRQVRKMSRHESCDSYASEERSAADLLKDFKDPDFLAVRESELGSSGEQDSPITQRMKIQDVVERESRGGGASEYRSGNMSNTSSFNDLCGVEDIVRDWESSSVKSATASVDAGMDALAVLGEGSHTDQQVRQDSSQSDVFISDPTSQHDAMDSSEVGAVAEKSQDGELSPEVTTNPLAMSLPQKEADDVTTKLRPLGKNTLREGFRWQRQLVFRSKLTMHTAFERKDNKEPAAVTAIAISKDHKTVYVGDGRGRIFSWTVTDQPGRVVADHWMKDEGVEACPVCNVRFSFAERRHHCRNCGKVFCSKCSRFETEIRRLRILKPVRVCLSCYNILRAQQAADALAQTAGRG